MKVKFLPLFRKIMSLGLILVSQACSKVNIPAPEPVLPVPTTAQLQWHELEFYGFVHFSINTFTDKEWGFGDESPSLFNPDSLDVSQWVATFKEAGMKAVIITAKHHDGFCLWPSAFTEHSIKNSPYKDGNGDLLRDLAEACTEAGLKFGVYLSPWDRNHSEYGSAEYVTYYRNQLKEVFNNYGPIFEMWFDGANGGDGYYGGANETRRIDGSTYYNWPETIQMVRSLEPNILFFSDAGPEIRWVGNERGVAGATNWNMITPDTLYAGKPGITGLLNTGSEDGSQWIPAEVDVSIRPGWFYHESQNNEVKTAEELFEIYLTSVGRGSNLLLNVPPNNHGLISDQDVESLSGLRKLIEERFRNNLTSKASISATNTRGNNDIFQAENLFDGKNETYWATDDEIRDVSLQIDLEEPIHLRYLILKEFISLGQRVKEFEVEAMIDGQWLNVANETTIGYKRILSFTDLKNVNKIRIRILDARACPVLSEIEIY